MVMQDNQLVQQEGYEPTDYAQLFPFTDDAVIEKAQGLYVVKSDYDFAEPESPFAAQSAVKDVTEEVKNLDDIEVKESIVSGKELKAAVEQGVVTKCRVIMTLDDNSSTKEKNLNIDKLIDDKMVFGKSDIILRVMSSGEIKKQIIVKADEFAVEAVKLILLANSKDVKFEIKEEVKAKV
jgi:hypothetical protein